MIRGRDLADLLRNAARALNAIILSEDSVVRPEMERTISLDSLDSDTLLVDWLNELIYRSEVEQLVFSEFQFDTLQDGLLVARCRGEYLDASRHRVIREVKAATYHMSDIRRTQLGYHARVVFDV